MSLPRRSEFPRFSPEWWESVTTFDRNTGCLLWGGFADKHGYCRTWVNGKNGVLVHRIAYECFYGPFDQSFKVCHSCDNPRCVHPHHLFLGTQKDNLRDMFAKGRARPRGRAVAGFTKKMSPTLALPELLSENLNQGVVIGYKVHLTRTAETPNPDVPAWCRVIGVPPVQPTQAVTLYKRPLEWTGNQQAGIPSGASLAECCESPVSSIRSVRKAGQR